MIILVGASASGKTEVARRLFRHFGYRKIVTTTTRAPRTNERDGVDYHFIENTRFAHLRECDAFVEVTRYGDYFYGIQKKDIDPHGVVIVDPNGANALVKALLDQVFVVMVETAEMIRKKRMLQRGDSLEDTMKRLRFDRRHFRKENFLRIDHVVSNDQASLEDLANDIHNAYQMHRIRRAKDALE